MYLFIHSPKYIYPLNIQGTVLKYLQWICLSKRGFLGKKKTLSYTSISEHDGDHLISLPLLALLLVGLVSSAFLRFNRKMTSYILYLLLNDVVNNSWKSRLLFSMCLQNSVQEMPLPENQLGRGNKFRSRSECKCLQMWKREGFPIQPFSLAC